MRYAVAGSAAELQPHVQAWQRLAEEQGEELFSTPAFLLPLVEHYPLAPFLLLFIYLSEEAGEGEKMIAFVPFRRRSRRGLILGRHLALLSHPHIGWAQPYFHPAFAAEAASALLAWCREAGPGTLVCLSDLDGESSFYRAFSQTLEKSVGAKIELSSERAVMRWCGKPQDYLQRQLSAKKRKQVRNLKNRLHGKGDLQVVIECEPAGQASLLEEFLDLDDRSTKGQNGEGPLYNENDRRFYRRVIDRLAGEAQVSFAIMRLDGRVIAMQLNIIRQKVLFAYKTAYDQRYRKYSPGTLLEVELMEWFQGSDHLRLADSCTEAGSSIEGLWKERKPLRTILFPVSRVGWWLLAAARTGAYGKKALAVLRRQRD